MAVPRRRAVSFGGEAKYSERKKTEWYPNGQIKLDYYEKDIGGKWYAETPAAKLAGNSPSTKTFHLELGMEVPAALAEDGETSVDLSLLDARGAGYIFPKDNAGNPIRFNPLAGGTSRIDQQYPAQSGQRWRVLRSINFVPANLDPDLDVQSICYVMRIMNADATLIDPITTMRLAMLLYNVTDGAIRDSQVKSLVVGATTPIVRYLSPSQGPLAGGTALTIHGAGFLAGATVRIGGNPATNVQVISSSQISCTTPPSDELGPATVVVHNPAAGGGHGSTQYIPFTYV